MIDREAVRSELTHSKAKTKELTSPPIRITVTDKTKKEDLYHDLMQHSGEEFLYQLIEFDLTGCQRFSRDGSLKMIELIIVGRQRLSSKGNAAATIKIIGLRPLLRSKHPTLDEHCMDDRNDKKPPYRAIYPIRY